MKATTRTHTIFTLDPEERRRHEHPAIPMAEHPRTLSTALGSIKCMTHPPAATKEYSKVAQISSQLAQSKIKGDAINVLLIPRRAIPVSSSVLSRATKVDASFARSRTPEYKEQDVFTSLLILLPGNVKKIAVIVHAELQKS
jgi:hypothetical protein